MQGASTSVRMVAELSRQLQELADVSPYGGRGYRDSYKSWLMLIRMVAEAIDTATRVGWC